MTAELTRTHRPLRVAGPGRRSAVSRGFVARRLVGLIVAGLPVRLELPDGRRIGGGDEAAPVLRVLRPAVMFRRLEEHPKIGLGEGYMAGDWEAAPGSDLAEVMAPFAARMGALLPRPVLALRGIVDKVLPAHQRNTPDGSRANIEAHYDLGNELFERFLDPSLTYSAALFDPSRPLPDQDLREAQHRKIDAILDAAGVTEGTRLLEIGSGWGELALRAATRGAHVTTITLSREQAAYATEKVTRAGVGDRVDVRIEDYRETVGEFDAVVSVEMIEAVGEEFWPDYFATIESRLGPGGRAVIQAILMDHHRHLATRNSFGWIQKYIFPGGLIPSLTAIREVTERGTRLRLGAVRSFGADYAETLRRWRTTFDANWPEIRDHGYDETFRRMWEFYLAYCEAGFATGYLDVAHITFHKET